MKKIVMFVCIAVAFAGGAQALDGTIVGEPGVPDSYRITGESLISELLKIEELEKKVKELEERLKDGGDAQFAPTPADSAGSQPGNASEVTNDLNKIIYDQRKLQSEVSAQKKMIEKLERRCNELDVKLRAKR